MGVNGLSWSVCGTGAAGLRGDGSGDATGVLAGAGVCSCAPSATECVRWRVRLGGDSGGSSGGCSPAATAPSLRLAITSRQACAAQLSFFTVRLWRNMLLSLRCPSVLLVCAGFAGGVVAGVAGPLWASWCNGVGRRGSAGCARLLTAVARAAVLCACPVRADFSPVTDAASAWTWPLCASELGGARRVPARGRLRSRLIRLVAALRKEVRSAAGPAPAPASSNGDV